MDSVNSMFSQSFVFSLNVLGRLLILLIDVIFFSQSLQKVKGQMNQNFDIRSLASLKQLNTTTDHYKVYSPKNFAS